MSTCRSGVSAGDSVGNTKVGSGSAVAVETGNVGTANVDAACGVVVLVAVAVSSL